MQISWKGEAPGFDVEAAIASLAAWTLADAVANDVEDLKTRTASALAKSTDHIVMHDHQAETPCLAQPCPTLGVSWSLTLCVMHQRERSVFAPWLEFADQAERSASEIRKQSNMPEFRKRPPPNRRPLELLTGVWQHLRFDGGFTYAAIAALVPDEQGPRGLPGRIKAAMRRPDARWQSANARPARKRKKTSG